MKLPIAILIALSASPALAQCPTGFCPWTFGRASYARYQAVQPVQTCTTVAPCEPVAEIKDEPVPACEPVETCEVVNPCAPVCVPSTENIERASAEYDRCVGGSCPIRSITSAALNVPRTVVANLLDVANRTRVRYGLAALSYDANLEAGAQYQANYCAQRGALIHGRGAIEILAYNSQGLEAALNQWLASPAHRQILLNGGYRYAGVAVVRDRYGRSWCAMRFR